MTVTARTLRLVDDLRTGLQTVTDTHTRALVSAWADAWDEVSADLVAAVTAQLEANGKITRAALLRAGRLRTVLGVIADHLTDLADTAGVTVTGDLHAVVDTAGAAQAVVVDSQLPSGTDLVRNLDAWSRVDTKAIDAIVARSTQQITSLARPLPAETYQVVRRELIRGVAAGSNPRQTAARIVKRAEGGFNGGLNRALVIARTETLDAHRQAAALAQQAEADVLTGWSWLAKLDARTCRSCWAQHGRVHDLSEPGPLDHQQGRCVRLPVTKSWADLGYAVVEPPSLVPDAGILFDGLSPAEQQQILGPRGYTAWVNGQFPLDDWSKRRDTPGWRPSYGVASAPVQSSGGRTAAVA